MLSMAAAPMSVLVGSVDDDVGVAITNSCGVMFQ